MDQKTHLQRRMERDSIPKLVLSFALPCGISMIVTSLYSLADSYFVSSLSAQASAAVSAMFAVQVLLQAVGYTLGMGGATLLSRALGKKSTEEAARYASSALLYALIIGSGITLLSLLFQEKLILLLGVDPQFYQEAKSYAVPLFCSAVPTCASFVLTQLLRSEGRIMTTMWGQLLGCAVNLFSDPLLIHSLKLGTAGASLATLLAHCSVSAFLLGSYFSSKKSFQLFSVPLFSLFSPIKEITVAGLPSFFRQGLFGLATVLFNHAALQYGPDAMKALSTVNRLFLFAFGICLGFGQGMMPIVGYQYGAKDIRSAKKAYSFSVFAATASMAALSLPLFLFAPQAIALFSKEEQVIVLGVGALRALSLILFSHGPVTCTIMYLQAIGRSVLATLLACARQGFFFLPLLFLLTDHFGWNGLVWVQPVADVATLILTVPFALFFIKKANKVPGTQSV